VSPFSPIETQWNLAMQFIADFGWIVLLRAKTQRRETASDVCLLLRAR
jgi:hypothetical protein